MEVARTPWTEPYTIRERVQLRIDSKLYDVKSWWRAGLWTWLAGHAPRRFVLFAFIRVMANASVEHSAKHPNEITYEEAYKAWENA